VPAIALREGWEWFSSPLGVADSRTKKIVSRDKLNMSLDTRIRDAHSGRTEKPKLRAHGACKNTDLWHAMKIVKHD